ncbi:MAG: hypothetical protein OEV85_08805 [Candidatus Thorarchaeota archaeon]|nr:hypothetical protein [Candidatus Thorarchaeota archaeon]
MDSMRRQTATLFLVSSLIILSLGTSAVATPISDSYSMSQIVTPFKEMLPGIYVASQWWNETGDDYSINTEPSYFVEINDSRYVAQYYVEDIYNQSYTITENSISNWTSDWSFSNLLVVIILDPDATYIAWLANQGNTSDLWSIFWWPESGALSGDEVFIYSSFYYSEYNSSSYYWAEYTWRDEFGGLVNPNDVIPYLSEEYMWASYMNDTYEFDYDWHYCGFGYDVNEMFRTDTTEQWMQHYFSGLSVFNDTNNNNRMDLVYSEVPYDFDEDGTIDWTNYELNRTASELVYDFYADNAKIGEIGLPAINSDGQIEWSAEVIDINGNLLTTQPYDIWIYGAYPLGSMPEKSDPLPVTIDSLKLTFRFETTNDAAVIKIDQFVGDFKDPISGLIPIELNGLGLTLNYWSSFSSYTITGEIPVEPLPVTGGEEPLTPETGTYAVTDWTDAPSAPLESNDVPDGFLRFTEESHLRMTVEFGGTYVWGSNGLTYDVGTAVMPMYFYSYGIEASTPSADLAFALDSWWGQTYYYSSCYAKWDGYSVTHDPIFSAFPMNSPLSASAFITGLINSAIILGVVGIAAIIVVCARINTERK